MPSEGNYNLKPDLNIAFVSAVGSHAQQVEVATKNLLGKKTYDMKSQELLDVERKKYGGMKMSESAEKREGNFGKKVLTFFERVWKTSITRPLHEVKEARVGGELMIAAGLDTAITAEFDAVIDAKARERIEAKRDVWYKKLGGGISDFANELIGREKELHREKIKVTGDLRSEYLSNPGDKSHPFHQLLHRDTLARESLAEKFATAPADFLHEKDLRSDTVDLDPNSPISKFLKETVFKDVIGDTIDQIDAGNYTGNISEKKRLDLDKKLKDFFFTDEFTAWRNGLPEAQRAQFENSLTYTTNVLSQAESVIMPLVKDNLSHFRTNRELDFNIKLTLGTGQFGPNSELTGISRFSKERISKNAALYERMRARVVSEPNFLYSADYMRMGNAQKVSLAALNSVATSEVVSAVAGIATGKGLVAALHANIEWVPIVGGLFAGGMAGYKEYNEVGKMRDRFGAQIAEGYTHPAGINAVRAEALRKVVYHRVDLGVRALDLKNVVDKLKSGDQSEETILNTLGFLADSKARTSLSDKRHVNLFRASSDTPEGRGNFQQQDMIHAKLRVLATGEINTLLTGNDALRQQIATKLGYDQNYTVTQMLDSLSTSQAEYLEKGTSVSTAVQLALHAITPAEAKAIDAQDKAFNKYRSKEVLKKAVMSGVLAGVATWGIGHFVTGHDEVVAGGVAHKSEMVLDHTVPSHVSPVTIGEVQDPNTHEILASMNAHIPQGTTLQADIQHPGAFDLVLANDPHRVLVNDMTFTDGHLNMTTEIRDALAHSHIQYRGVPTGSIDIAGQAGGFNPGETMTLTYGNMPGANEGGLDQWIANQLNHSFRALPEPKLPDQIPVERVTDINGIRFLYHAFEQHEKSLNHNVFSLDQIPGYVRKIHEHATTGTILTEPQASTFSIHDVPSVMGTEDGQRKIADLIHEAVRQKLSGQPFSDEAHRIMYEASYMGTTDKIPDPKEFEIVMQYLGAGAASAPTQGVSAQLNDAFFTMTGDLIDVKTVPLADVINHVAQYNVVGGLVSTFGYSVPLEAPIGKSQVKNNSEYDTYYAETGFGQGRRLRDILSFSNNSSNQQNSNSNVSYNSNYPDASYLSDKSNNEEGQKVIESLSRQLSNADRIYVSLGGAVGDAIIGANYATSLNQGIKALGKNIPITVVINADHKDLFGQMGSNINIEVAQRGEAKNHIQELANDRADLAPVIFDFEHYSNNRPQMSQVTSNGKTITTVNDLFAPAIQLYNNETDGERRYTHFIEEILGLSPDVISPDDSRFKVSPPVNNDQVYRDVSTRFGIDRSKEQVGIVVEASMDEKRYPMNRWVEVIQKLAVEKPTAEYSIIYNESSGNPNFSKASMTAVLASLPINIRRKVHLISGTMSEITSVISHQSLLLSNDTGLAHLGANLENGPKVVSLHVPRFSPNLWVSNALKQKGIISSTNDISSIDPNTVVESIK